MEIIKKLIIIFVFLIMISQISAFEDGFDQAPELDSDTTVETHEETEDGDFDVDFVDYDSSLNKEDVFSFEDFEEDERGFFADLINEIRDFLNEVEFELKDALFSASNRDVKDIKEDLMNMDGKEIQDAYDRAPQSIKSKMESDLKEANEEGKIGLWDGINLLSGNVKDVPRDVIVDNLQPETLQAIDRFLNE